MTSHPPSARHLNILVVDDEFGTRASLGVVLALAGHHAVFANDGDDALKLFDTAKVPFDLIITDHAMARVSGIELVRGLREKGFTGEIFVLTAYAGTIEENEYKKLQVMGVMEKPFDITELRHWLDCIHGHRYDESEDAPPAPRRAIDFCWLKRD